MEARKGRQTPTETVFLPYKHSKGEEAVKLYEKSGRELMPWQAEQLNNIMATDGDLWTHSKYGTAVPRRNGKNEVIIPRELYALVNGERVLHTAHRTTTGHQAYERLIEVLGECGYTEGKEFKTIRALGVEVVTWEASGGKINFRTRSNKGGIGEGYDLLIIDEAQEYTTEQESAIKYVVSASPNPQTLFFGTPPTPTSAGTVFSEYRKATRNGETPNGGWAEWSVGKMTDINDRDAWYEANPSLGTILTERAIIDEIGPDEVDFNIQRLGLWLKYNQKSAISQTDWEALQVETLPELMGPLFVGVKYAYSGENVAVSVAVRTEDGIFVEGYDCRPISAGTDWIVGFLAEAQPAAVVVDGANGQGVLAEAMRDVRLAAPTLPSVAEIVKANAAWELAIQQGGICHKGQPAMTQAVSNCEKRNIGNRGGFGYQSLFEGVEIAIMESAILAYWACAEHKVKKKQRVSV